MFFLLHTQVFVDEMSIPQSKTIDILLEKQIRVHANELIVCDT